MKISSKKVGGIYLSGGKNGGYFGVLLELFSGDTDKRWFIKSIFNSDTFSKDQKEIEFINWIKESGCKFWVTDIPLTSPICHDCDLSCPGENNCKVQEVQNLRLEMENLLGRDLLRSTVEPKKYEIERKNKDLFDKSKDWRDDENELPPLSASFRRKLKSGFLPYWNRSIDLYIWKYFYDDLLSIFNYSFDSFGHCSLMLINRIQYLKKQLGEDVSFFESNINLVLLQLLRAKKITKKSLNGLRFLDETTILKKKKLIVDLEKNLNLFAYQSDIEDLILDPQLVNAFILAISGRAHINQSTRALPDWCSEKFIVPDFSSPE